MKIYPGDVALAADTLWRTARVATATALVAGFLVVLTCAVAVDVMRGRSEEWPH